MRIAPAAIFLLFLLPYAGSSLYISEIMYNPNGTDTGREWIEIYNNDSAEYNVTGWKLVTAGSNHTLNAPPANGGAGDMAVSSGEYIIIAQEAATFLSDYNYSGTVIDSSWSDLTNSANETIAVKNSTWVFDSVTTPANVTEGRSLCIVNNTLSECEPTPGLENTLANISIQANETQNSTQPGSCNLSLAIATDSAVYGQETIGFDIILNDTGCSGGLHNTTVSYMVEDLFGSVVKADENTTSEFACTRTIGRQWTPGSVQGSEAYYIKSFISSAGCNDTGAPDNNATRMVVVKGSQATQVNESNISITSIDAGTDNEVKYGEQAGVSIDVYRGDTSKTSVDVYVEAGGKKLSETTNFNVKTKFSSYTMSVPIQMKPNCDGSFADGNFTVVVEGLNASASRQITVRGVSSSACKTVASGGSGGSSCSLPANSTVSVKNCTQLKYEIVGYEPSVVAGKEFTVAAKIYNAFNETKNFTVYSYAFSGSNPVTLGYDAGSGEWRAAYNANSQDAELPPGSSSIVYLKSMVEKGTEPGAYSLRARIVVDGKNSDVTNQIQVIGNSEGVEAEPEPAVKEEAITEELAAEGTPADNNIATGFAVNKREAYNETHVAAILVEILKTVSAARSL